MDEVRPVEVVEVGEDVRRRVEKMFPERVTDLETEEGQREKDLEVELYEVIEKLLVPLVRVDGLSDDIRVVSSWIIEAESGGVSPRDRKVYRLLGREMIMASYVVALTETIERDYLSKITEMEVVQRWEPELEVLKRGASMILKRSVDVVRRRNMRQVVSEWRSSGKLDDDLVKKEGVIGQVIPNLERGMYGRLEGIKKAFLEHKRWGGGLEKFRGLELWGLTEEEMIDIYGQFLNVLEETSLTGQIDDILKVIDFLPDSVLYVKRMWLVGQAFLRERSIRLAPRLRRQASGENMVEIIRDMYDLSLRHELGHLMWQYLLGDKDKNEILEANDRDEEYNGGYPTTYRYRKDLLEQQPEWIQQQEVFTCALEIYWGKDAESKKAFPNMMGVLDDLYAKYGNPRRER